MFLQKPNVEIYAENDKTRTRVIDYVGVCRQTFTPSLYSKDFIIVAVSKIIRNVPKLNVGDC